jgi:hypothetical protein
MFDVLVLRSCRISFGFWVRVVGCRQFGDLPNRVIAIGEHPKLVQIAYQYSDQPAVFCPLRLCCESGQTAGVCPPDQTALNTRCDCESS